MNSTGSSRRPRGGRPYATSPYATSPVIGSRSHVPGDREALHPVDVRGLRAQANVFSRYGETQRGEAVDQRGERDPHLDAGQLLTQALVDAVAEGQVPAVLPAEVEHVGIGEALGVAVGGVVRQDDRRTGLDGLAAHLDVLQRR